MSADYLHDRGLDSFVGWKLVEIAKAFKALSELRAGLELSENRLARWLGLPPDRASALFKELDHAKHSMFQGEELLAAQVCLSRPMEGED